MKRVLVTGGAGGIGSAICRNFANNGYQVAVHYHSSRAAAEALCRETKRVCFSGFGVGLTYGGIVMNCGNFDFCGTINFPNKGE